MAAPAGLDFLVNKSDWKQHRFDDAPVPEPGPGQVRIRMLESVAATEAERIEARRHELQAWLGTTVVTPRFPTPLQKELAAG